MKSHTKNDKLAALTMEVAYAQDRVNQWQATVASLTGKLTRFLDMLAQAETKAGTALNNKNLADQLVQSACDLQNNSDLSFAQMTAAGEKTGALAKQVKMVMDKLIYTAEAIDKLANQVIRKKAVNPLISDELVRLLEIAGTDASNAMALTLVALQSTFSAQVSSTRSGSVITLENEQARALYIVLTNGDTSLQTLISQAYRDALDRYAETKEACTAIAVQMDEATLKLNDAEVKLKLLQEALTVANDR